MKTGGRVAHNLDSFNKKLKNRGIKYYCVSFNDYRSLATFYCEEHDHYFEAYPNSIDTGRKSCPLCSGYKFWTPESYNKHLEENNRNIICYDFYSVNVKTKHECLVCNHGAGGEWNPKPSDIINGCGCPKCAIWTLEKYNKHLEENNRNIICYELITTKANANHECLVCGNVWSTSPSHVLRGSGCPYCAKYGFNKGKPAIYYYVKIVGHNLYKGGITNNTIKYRFGNEYNLLEEIFNIKFDLGEHAYNFEQKLLNQFGEYRYKGESVLKSGNTEIFTIDIFNGNYDDINIIGQ
jgi:hypothetical protein